MSENKSHVPPKVRPKIEKKQPAPQLIMQVRQKPLARWWWEWRIILDMSGKRSVLESGRKWGKGRAQTKARLRAIYFQASLTRGWQGVNPK